MWMSGWALARGCACGHARKMLDSAQWQCAVCPAPVIRPGAAASSARGMGPALPAPAATPGAPRGHRVHQHLSRPQSLPLPVRQRRARLLPATLALTPRRCSPHGATLPVAATSSSAASLPLSSPSVSLGLASRQSPSKYHSLPPSLECRSC